MERAFSAVHPLVSFSFFLIIIVFTLLLLHPVFTGISLTAALVFSWLLHGRKGVKFSLVFCIPMFLLIALANPLFNHRGKTVLFYLRDNPVTLEAVLYGLCAAASLIAVVLWFSCYSKVITSDKFLYLFAKAAPTVALLITMTLRMIPQLKTQLTVVTSAQQAIGLDARSGNVVQRIKRSMRIVSILLSWSMEDGIETADSMKARGYGLKNRTTFSLFKFDKRDGLFLTVVAVLTGTCFAGYFLGLGTMRFYPSVAALKVSGPAVGLYTVFGVLAFLPMIFELRESLKWHSYKLKT
ncbi:MAG TPA: energy-coupling factor transporter transmembrane component T [Desulfitobacteriaceae bacterium]|nr:energy-coupling factor transporter transmembrane component T [Desulfitobacteriaceae bacterium]